MIAKHSYYFLFMKMKKEGGFEVERNELASRKG